MAKIIDRIHDYIHYKGLSMRSFESQAGLTNGIISTALKRKTDISWESVSKIVDTYKEIDIEWLITGNGQMLKIDNEIIPIQPQLPLVTQPVISAPEDLELPTTDEFEYVNNDNGGKIPVVHELAFATIDPEDPGKIQGDDVYYIKEFRNADFLMRMQGDYMSPKYRSGDLLACRNVKEDCFYQWGRIYALLTCHQGLVIGRVYEHFQNTIFVTVKPINPDYPEWVVPIDEIARIALVIGSISLD